MKKYQPPPVHKCPHCDRILKPGLHNRHEHKRRGLVVHAGVTADHRFIMLVRSGVTFDRVKFNGSSF